MSAPYVYTPIQQTFEPPSTPYIYPYFHQPHVSPFIPPIPLFPSSPGRSPGRSPRAPPSPWLPPIPDTPTTPNTRRVHFDDDPFALPNVRPRRPSWAGSTPTMTTVPMAPPASPYLQAPNMPYHNRRHSWGNTVQPPPWSNFTPPAMTIPLNFVPRVPQFLVHPFLNGESPRPDFGFDLSATSFQPVRFINGLPAALTMAELREPATHPPITHLRIVCDAIPQWPIELEYHPYDASGEHLSLPPHEGGVPPVSLGDVLFAIHSSLHVQISHLDWGRLTVSEETAIARAYTRRCRSVPSISQLEASQGVKRVDFLLDRFMFRGLVRAPGDDGFNEWKLIV